jgi:serine/threonine protein kinase
VLTEDTKVITNDCFALKTIAECNSRKKAEIFDKEKKALSRFSGFIHDHLVTLLMTWTYRGQCCLLFPLATIDLDEYWSLNGPPIREGKPDAGDLCWIAKQIFGMAGALDTMHNPKYTNLTPEKKYARHGDIKPENILWYKSPTDPRGIWVISDLGLTTFNSTKSRSMIPGQFVANTPDYRPPECDLEGGMVSRAFDVWTYGCLLLELVSWALGGQELRKEFEKRRRSIYVTNVKSEIFFDIQIAKDTETRHVVMVKPEVSKVCVSRPNKYM